VDEIETEQTFPQNAEMERRHIKVQSIFRFFFEAKRKAHSCVSEIHDFVPGTLPIIRGRFTLSSPKNSNLRGQTTENIVIGAVTAFSQIFVFC
jgi:hypothetical protein